MDFCLSGLYLIPGILTHLALAANRECMATNLILPYARTLTLRLETSRLLANNHPSPKLSQERLAPT